MSSENIDTSENKPKHLSITESWKFDENDDILFFPRDKTKQNYVRREVRDAIFSAVNPTPMKSPTRLAVHSAEVAEMLDLDPSVVLTDEFRDMVSGSEVHPTSSPLAHRYGGHQFGSWADQLGDGRAHLLGVYRNSHGFRLELQLKGSGPTPYSRSGDGRAVIRSSVREFLAAEAMAALGFRTSRCLSLVTSDEVVLRDQFYNGKMKMEKIAVVLRTARSWFRFGSFEILTRNEELDNLKTLIDHVIKKHYPDISVEESDCHLQLFSRIVEETAEMVAQWQSVGFTHGVMNTDNLSILSETIDYGPFGFLEEYDPKFVPNSSDDDGLYRYENQPKIAYLNLLRLSHAFLPIIDKTKLGKLNEIMNGFDNHYKTYYRQIFSRKFGFEKSNDKIEDLLSNLLAAMKDKKADFSNTFWELGNVTLVEVENGKVPESFWSLPLLTTHKRFKKFLNLYKKMLFENEITEEARNSIMKTQNPKYILRNWIAQNATSKVEYHDFNELNFVHNLLKNPFDVNEEAENKGYSKPPPKWAKQLRVSCSS